MSIRIMIAEDERLAREELAHLLQVEEGVILCPAAETGDQLLTLYPQHHPDVIFLDIQMPGLSGTEVARRLLDARRKEDPLPLFVFTTAYDDYAVEAFDLEAVDYLLKPYDERRFKKAMEKVRRRLDQRPSLPDKTTQVTMAAPPPFPSLPAGRLLIENGDKVLVLSPNSICYAVRVGRLLEIHTEGEILKSKMTLQELEGKLQGYSFFRTHRSYLVNLDFIQEITPWFNGAYNLVLNNEQQSKIPVSRSAAKRLFQFLGR